MGKSIVSSRKRKNQESVSEKSLVPVVVVQNQKAVTTSLEVALRFGKKHDNVLKAVRNIVCSKSFADVNFNASEYIDSTGRKLPMYYITRDGFMFLGMGFTGEKAAKFKEDFIDAFNRRENEILWLQSILHANRQNTIWLETRKSGKSIRKDETDVVQVFVEYAIKQGSKTPKCIIPTFQRWKIRHCFSSNRNTKASETF